MVNVYQQTKFCRQISIHGSDITTSDLDKQTSAILQFYFLFRSQPFRHNLHVILHQVAEFRPNWRTLRENVVISISQDTTSDFLFVDVTVFRRSLSIS